MILMLRSEVRNMLMAFLVLHVVFVKHHTTIVQVAFGLPGHPHLAESMVNISSWARTRLTRNSAGDM
jgi:hypothetical protein